MEQLYNPKSKKLMITKNCLFQALSLQVSILVTYRYWMKEQNL